MSKAIKYLTNFIIHATLGSILLFGGGVMWMALNTNATPWWGGFYFGLIVAAIPLWVWGIVGRLIRLPWQLFKLIHQRWWSAIAFWGWLAFMGLPQVVTLFGFGFFVILPRLPLKRGGGDDDDCYYGIGPQYFRNPGD